MSLYFFDVFFVAFLGFGFFVPHAIIRSSPPFPFYVDLFIYLNLSFVKNFLSLNVTPRLGARFPWALVPEVDPLLPHVSEGEFVESMGNEG